MSTLFLVATPIGNLEDISARAKRVLAEVPLIAAEDTRHTGKLLAHLEIQTPLTSYHDHNKGTRTRAILDALVQHDVALVSDAGTPALNDPGYELVRAALEAGHNVIPIPGPSAPVAALVASGLPTDSFLYLGYLPRKGKARRDLLAANAGQPHTLVILETPHRLVDALLDVEEALGNREIAVARELTKMHEEFIRGTAARVRAHFEEYPPRGEITLVIAGHAEGIETWSEENIKAAIQKGLDAGKAPSRLAKEIAVLSGWKRRDVYSLLTELQE